MNSALQLARTEFWDMMGEERFNSFMREVPIIYLLCKLLDWFLNGRDLHHERVNVVACIYQLIMT